MMKIEKLIEWLRNNNREDNCHDCALGYYLEPEEMLSGIDVAKIACALHELNAYKDLGPIDHLRELAKADREGRCVVLPCKVGDTVYLLEKNRVLENKVLQVSFNNSGDWVVFTDCKSLLFCKIGETAFITPEAALKAREQDDQNNNML